MPSEKDWEDYFREKWNNEPAAHLSEELQQAIKSHPNFSTPPLGPIGDYIVSDKLRSLIPQSFATSYVVHSGEDVHIMRELASAHGEPHPAVMVYPQCETMNTVDKNLTVFDMSMASLQCENPTIANVVIDWFGTTTGMLCEFLAMYNMHVYLLTYFV